MEENTRDQIHTKSRRVLNYKEQIMDILRDSEHGVTSSKIASQLALAWRTVNKYLGELTKEGRVQAHNIGAYTIYLAQKVGEQSIYPVLYCAAMKIGGSIVQGEEVNAERIAIALRGIWEELGGQVTVPFESEISAINGRPTPEILEHLLEVMKKILCEFGYFGKYPQVEIFPPIGSLTPMTRRIRLTDPGYIMAGAGIHYSLLAGLLQEKLIQKTGFKVMFRVAGEIQPKDEVVEFELGFVDHYIMDLNVVEQGNPEISPRDYLGRIENFLSTFFRRNLREYKVGETLHNEVTCLDNTQVEDFFAARAKAVRKNVEIIQKYNIQPTRKCIPWEDWPPGPPYVVIDFVTNLGFFFDEFVSAIRKSFTLAGYCVQYETIPNGVRMHFLEKEDFEIFFSNIFDDQAMREHYRFFGITSEDYFRERKAALLEVAQEVIKERAEWRAKRRKKSKEKPDV